jgi:hypothetical protein
MPGHGSTKARHCNVSATAALRLGTVMPRPCNATARLGFSLGADTELDFTMHLGRTGEVYFVTEVDEEVEGELEGKPTVRMSNAWL